MFRILDISGEGFESYGGKEISHLAKVNLFVGQNNSGKSRLIRKIFSARKLTFAPKDIPIEQIIEKISNYNNDLISFIKENRLSIFKTMNDLSEEAKQLCKKIHKFIEEQNQFS